MLQNNREIGKVVKVDSYQVTIELDSEIKSPNKIDFDGIYPVAQINSYLIIPVGMDRIVCIVHRVTTTDDTALSKEGNILNLTLPEQKRLVFANMVGTLKAKKTPSSTQLDFEFEYGVTIYPILNNPVWFILKGELDIIFSADFQGKNKYFLEIGKSVNFPDQLVRVNPDEMFGKHLAVLGNTGSGKSCTIASILQSIFKRKEVTNAHFVIFDTNGEYKAAFEGITDEETKKRINYFLIDQSNFKVPYWFMNFQEFQDIFGGYGESKTPALYNAIAYARNEFVDIALNVQVQTAYNEIFNYYKNSLKYNNNDPQKTLDYVLSRKVSETKILNDFSSSWRNQIINDDQKVSNLSKSVDDPSFFQLDKLVNTYFESYFKHNQKSREFCSELINRIERFINDPRYQFIFDKNYQKHNNALALFIRYILGLTDKIYNSDEGFLQEAAPCREFFTEERAIDEEAKKEILKAGESGLHQITIIDMSLLASDIIENVTALLGRIILEFLQRLKEEDRGKLPVVIILEEAHNYIPEKNKGEYEPISKIVFERIAREGRKFGLSLVLASQRPSELSKTVLSQCNSFIVHRIQNPEDQEYIKKIAPSIDQALLHQLPILVKQTAIVFGDCVKAPMHVRLFDANPTPESKDPKFWAHWTKEDEAMKEIDIESICRNWEGNQ